MEHNNSISILDLFLVLFVGLKLADQIDWSWWFVLSPIWIALIAVVVGTLFEYYYKKL